MRRREVIGALGALPLLASDAWSNAVADLRVSIAGFAPGTTRRIAWSGGKVVHILRRPGNTERAAHWDELGNPEWLVVLAICTHQACEPRSGIGPGGGWRCLCHGSEFDLSGRVVRGPATENLKRLPFSISGSLMTISFNTPATHPPR